MSEQLQEAISREGDVYMGWKGEISMHNIKALYHFSTSNLIFFLESDGKLYNYMANVKVENVARLLVKGSKYYALLNNGDLMMPQYSTSGYSSWIPADSVEVDECTERNPFYIITDSNQLKLIDTFGNEISKDNITNFTIYPENSSWTEAISGDYRKVYIYKENEKWYYNYEDCVNKVEY